MEKTDQSENSKNLTLPLIQNQLNSSQNLQLEQISEKEEKDGSQQTNQNTETQLQQIQLQQIQSQNFPKLKNSQSQKIDIQHKNSSNFNNPLQQFHSPLGVPLAALHMRSQFLLNNQNGQRQDRLQSHQQGLDLVSQTIKDRQEFYLNSQILKFDKHLQKKALESSIIVPYEKSQYLTSEYIHTFQENYEWPASLQKALDHERATSIGRERTKLNARGFEVIDYKGCKCCLNNINKEPINWFKGHVNKDLPYQAGTAIPLYFNLIIFYTVIMLLVFLINGVYIIYQTYNICSYKILQHNYCANWGFLQFASKEYIRWVLSQTKSDEGELNLMVWLNFAAYSVLQISQIFMDVYIDKWQQQMGKPKSQQCSRSLLFTHIPKMNLVKEDGKNIYKKLQEENDIKKYLLKYIRNKAKKYNLHDTYQVVDMTVIYDYSKYDEFFNKRTNVYYKLKPILNNQERNREIDIIEMKAYMYFWNQYLKIATADFEGKVIVTFANSQQAYDIKNRIIEQSLLKSTWLHVVNFFGQFIMKEKIENYMSKHDFIRTELVNEPFEIIWQNFGIKSYDKRKEYVWTWIFFMISVLAMVILLYFVETYVSGTYISYLFLLLIVIHTVVTTVIAAQRKGKTHSSNTYFVVSRLTPFQILIIVVLPFIYYIKNYTYQLDSDLTENKFKVQSLKIENLFIQMLNFGVIIMFFCALDIPGYISRSRKQKIIKEKLEKQYCQSDLNEIFEKPEFNIEIHILNMIKVWGFSALHSFLCPYSIIICLVLMIAIYYISKYHLFATYTVKTYKSFVFLRQYLWYFSLFFQFLIFIIFFYLSKPHLSENAKAKSSEVITNYLSIAVYIICVITNIIRYMNFLNSKQKERKQDLQKSVIQQSQYVLHSEENSQLTSNNKNQKIKKNNNYQPQTKDENKKLNIKQDNNNNNDEDDDDKQSIKKIQIVTEPEDKCHYDIEGAQQSNNNYSNKNNDTKMLISGSDSDEEIKVHLQEVADNHPAISFASDQKSRLTVAYEKEKAYSNHYNIFKKKYYNPKLEEEIRSVLELKEIAKHQELQLQERILKNKQLLHEGLIKEESINNEKQSLVQSFNVEDQQKKQN